MTLLSITIHFDKRSSRFYVYCIQLVYNSATVAQRKVLELIILVLIELADRYQEFPILFNRVQPFSVLIIVFKA